MGGAKPEVLGTSLPYHICYVQTIHMTTLHNLRAWFRYTWAFDDDDNDKWLRLDTLWTIHCEKLLAFVSSNEQNVHYLTIAQPRESHNCGIYYLYNSCIHSMQDSCTPYFAQCITHVNIVAVHVWLLCIHGYIGPLWSVWCTCAVGNDATWLALPCAR